MLLVLKEQAFLQDTATLCVVVVRHCGYTAIIKVARDVKRKSSASDIDIDDQPDGGANALNMNRFYIIIFYMPPENNKSATLFYLYMISGITSCMDNCCIFNLHCSYSFKTDVQLKSSIPKISYRLFSGGSTFS